MRPGFENPTRLAQGPAPRDLPADPAQARAAQLLRVLQGPPPRLPPSARARIAARLDQAEHASVRVHTRAVWPVAVAAALILFAGGAVGASWGLAPARHLVTRILGLQDTPRHAAAEATAPAEARHATTPAAEPAIVLEVPDVAPPLASTPAPRRAGAAHAAASARLAAAESTPPAEDPVVAESRLLAEALTALRQRRDPQHALLALDQYDRRFPTGSLSPEAAAARIDALLALGRKGQALTRLEALSFERLPRAAEMQVLRGELRAGRGNLTGAVDDFEAALSAPGAPTAVIERALYGRSSCRSRMGDQAGARADLQEYMRRFPRGRFAAPAGHALGE
jgi:hypothetical protein